MSDTNSSDAAPTPAPSPQTFVQTALTTLFKVSLLAFLALGIALVLAQLAGVILGRGPLVEAAAATLAIPMTVAAGVAGLLGFVMSYVFHWEVSD